MARYLQSSKYKKKVPIDHRQCYIPVCIVYRYIYIHTLYINIQDTHSQEGLFRGAPRHAARHLRHQVTRQWRGEWHLEDKSGNNSLPKNIYGGK